MNEVKIQTIYTFREDWVKYVVDGVKENNNIEGKPTIRLIKIKLFESCKWSK